MYRLALFLSTVVLFASPTQTPGDIRFRHLSIKDGLSQSTVFVIHQDRYGFMWFGTNDGLNRYDGYTFEHFKHDSTNPLSLTDSWITSLTEDHQDRLWVGTFSYGLCRLSKNRKYFERIDLGLENISKGLSQNRTLALAEVMPGELWVGLESHGIVVLDSQGRRLTQYRASPKKGSLGSDEITAILVDGDHFIWIGTGTGLERFDRSTGLFAPFLGKTALGESPEHVTALTKDSSGRLWIGTKGTGIFMLDETGRLFRYTEGLGDLQVTALLTDRDGVLWVGTEGGGLNCFDEDKKTFTTYLADPFNPDALCDNAIYSLFQDRGGLIWVGSYSDGLSRFNLELQGFHHTLVLPGAAESLSGNGVTSFAPDDEKLWISTRKNGLNLYDPRDETYRHYRAGAPASQRITSDEVRHVIRDRQGIVWAGTELGLNAINQAANRVTHFWHGEEPGLLNADAVMYLMEDEADRFWVATYGGGLNLLNRASGRFRAFVHVPEKETSIANNLVNHMLVDQTGRMWVATEGGLDLMDREGETFTHFAHEGPRSLSHPSVMVSFQREGETDTLWLGTYGGGLNKLTISNGTFAHYTIHDGLANDAIYGILADDMGRLWITTNGGISRFQPETGEFRNFDTSNGLIRNEFNRNAYFRSEDGRLFFGGYGYCTIDPLTVKGNTYIPPLVLTSVRLSNTDLDTQVPLAALKELVLEPDDHVVSLSFAAMDFNSPGKNRFAHRLDGLLNQWIDLKDHDITYTSLNPGTYTLRIKGTNSDGLWNEEGLVIPVRVKPPFYRTNAAYFVYLVLLVVLLGASFRYRKRENNRELQRAMSLGKAEFATTVLHNIANVLNSVKVSCDKTTAVLRSSKMKQLVRAQELLQENLHNIDPYLKEDPRGKLLPDYFRSAGELVLEEQREMIRECDEMAEQIALMKDIIETQQAHASISLMDEAHNLNQVVRDALKVQENGLNNRGIVIEERLRPLPPIKLPKTQLMHIVINLVKNAREAMEANGDREKRLLLETGRHGDTEVYLKIQDTGVGISAENISKMFTYGFTTKRDGHGFGLNFCSRAMKEMGGSIEVESEGVGKGAAFTLLFRAMPNE